MIGLFYSTLNLVYVKAFGRPQMLHYPLHRHDGQTLMQGQIHFTEACLDRLGDVGGKRLLDIGCGNGVQTLYIEATRAPAHVLGVDLNPGQVRIASEAAQARRSRARFIVDDAQRLTQVADAGFDCALCTESAHHYADKNAFLAQLSRVLRPGGRFVIADLLLRDGVKWRPLDPHLSLFYWRLEHYRQALPAHDLGLDVEEELTDDLIAGFLGARHWFAGATAGSRSGRHFARLIGRGLVSLYLYELRHRYRYYLLAGAKV